MRAALADLERSGAIRRARGRSGGIFVAERKVERDLTSLAGLPAYLRRQGFQSDARVISTATARAPTRTTAVALGLGAEDLVHEVVRVRLADGEPISLERATFPAAAFPGLLDHSLSGLALRAAGRALRARARRGARSASRSSAPGPPEAQLLGVARGRAAGVDRAHGVDAPTGVAFEHSHDLFRGDRVPIVVRARSAPQTLERGRGVGRGPLVPSRRGDGPGQRRGSTTVTGGPPWSTGPVDLPDAGSEASEPAVSYTDRAPG